MTKQVRIIPAKPKNELKQEQKKGKLRVAAYCRVSTDDEEQLASYKNQIEYYTEKINSNPEWEMAGIYADEGISGTNTKHRAEFQKLMALCRRGRVDLILTKSVSRFARNTVDCLYYVRLLKEKGVGILFEKENINTQELSGELMLTFYGGFAQAESESISNNVAMGHRMAMKAGKAIFQYKKLYGYQRGSNGQPQIVEDEAAIVRRIFYSMLSGSSAKAIGDSLEKDNIAPPGTAKSWTPAAILRMLKNEVYAGDVLRQKTYVADFITKTVRKNTGELPQYYIMDNHPAIVSREVFNRVQEEFARRNSQISLSTKSASPSKGRFSSKYTLTELMRCGECGAAYRRVTWPAKERGGEKRIVWRCISRLEHGKELCHNSPTIPEAKLHEAILQAIRLLQLDTQEAKAEVGEVIASVIKRPEGETVAELAIMIKEREDKMIAMLAEKPEISMPDTASYAELQILANSISQLRLRKTALEKRAQADERAEQRIAEIMETLHNDALDISRYDDTLVRKLIESITVEPEEQVKVAFKNGAEITLSWK